MVKAKSERMSDERYAEMKKKAAYNREQGLLAEENAKALTDEGFTTRTGKAIGPDQVYAYCKEHEKDLLTKKKTSKNGQKKIPVYSEEIKEEVRTLYNSGFTTPEICGVFNKKGIKTAGGKQWDKINVEGIKSNNDFETLPRPKRKALREKLGLPPTTDIAAAWKVYRKIFNPTVQAVSSVVAPARDLALRVMKPKRPEQKTATGDIGNVELRTKPWIAAMMKDPELSDSAKLSIISTTLSPH